MAEDRMLSDEVLLALIKKNSGGGGGGTTNYNQLENKPQIAGTTLQGNKTLSDLGIASATALGSVAAAVTAITNGTEINSFGDVETALTGKQDANDNGLETEAKTIVGAINENAGDIDSLKSRSTNYENQNNLNLEVPNRKNVLPATLVSIKEINTNGTWDDNVYSYNGVDFTVNTNTDGYVTSITAANAETTANSSALYIPMPKDNNKYLFNGGVDTDHNVIVWDATTNASAKKWDGTTGSEQSTETTLLEFSNVSDHNLTVRCRVSSGVEPTSKTFYPMVCPAFITDPTFAPYIPSVESRIEAVEELQSIPNFSTTEQKTGQKWIDGKDIYFCTFTGLTITTSGNWQDTGIDSSGMDTILGGLAIDDYKQSIVCSFGFGTNPTVILRAYMATNVIKTITLYYTKTT